MPLADTILAHIAATRTQPTVREVAADWLISESYAARLLREMERTGHLVHYRIHTGSHAYRIPWQDPTREPWRTLEDRILRAVGGVGAMPLSRLERMVGARCGAAVDRIEGLVRCGDVYFAGEATR